MDRAVQDLVGSSALSLMPKNGADAMSQVVRSSGSMHDPPTAYSARPSRMGAASRASHFGSYVHPQSTHAITSDEAAPIAILRPRAIGPRDPFKLQLSSRMAMTFGYFALAACSRSHVPSVEPPSTMMTSAGLRVCAMRLVTSRSMSSTSLSTVAVTLTADSLA